MIRGFKNNLLQDKISSLILKQSFGVLAMQVANQGANFLLFVALARLMGVQEFGIFALAWSWSRILLNFAKFGLDLSGTKFFPIFLSENNWQAFRQFYRHGVKIIWLKSAAIILLGSAISVLLSHYNFLTQPAVYILAFLSLPFSALVMFIQPLMRSLNKTLTGLAPDMLVRPFLQVAFIVCLVVAGVRLDAEAVLLIVVLAGIIVWGLNVFSLKKALPDAYVSASQNAPLSEKDWYKFSCTMVLISSGGIILRQADTVMLGALTTAGEVGIYAAATRIANLITFVLTAVNLVAGTWFSKLYHENRMAELQRVLSLTAVMIFCGTLILTLSITAGAPLILSAFGESFEGGIWPLRWLLLGQLINALSGPVGYIMNMTGHHSKSARIFTAMIVINIVFNAFLIPLWGINGAAIATAIVTAMWNIILSLYVFKRLKLNATIFRRWRKRYD